MGLGKTVHSAIKTGFAKALSAIVDGNVTTLIAAAVLYWRGLVQLRTSLQHLPLVSFFPCLQHFSLQSSH
ncbi:MAG: hypothetical protein ACLR78_05965 [Roseburia sp.]